MHVTVNGEPRQLADGTTVAALLSAVGPATKGVAVAVDDAVVSRTAWPDVVLRDGARVEILTPRQGG